MMLRKSTALLIIFLMASSILSAGFTASSDKIGIREQEITETDSITNISNNSKWQMNSAIWGDKIVWQDYRNDPYGSWSTPGNRNTDIYLHNLTSGETSQLTQNGSSQVHPDIWKNYVVWEDYRNGDADIYMMDLNDTDKGAIRVTEDPSDQRVPKIDSGYITYEDYSEHSFGDIALHNIEEEESYFITDNRLPQSQPAIHEDRIVWTDYRNHWYDNRAGDIFSYDLSTDENDNDILDFKEEGSISNSGMRTITNVSKNQFDPDVFKDRVIWTEFNSSNNNDIYMQKIGAETRPLVRSPGREQNPEIFGGRIIYQKRTYGPDREPDTDSIWLYNYFEDEQSKLVEKNVDPDQPSIVKTRFPNVYKNHFVCEEDGSSPDPELDHQYDIFHTKVQNTDPQIDSVSVSNGTDTGKSVTMVLKEGNQIQFDLEAKDLDGDIEEVYVDAIKLNLNESNIYMNEVKADTFRTTLKYDQNMTDGEKKVNIHVVDSAGNTAVSDDLHIQFEELPPVIHSAGLGDDQDNLSDSYSLILNEAEKLIIGANITDYDDDILRVYLNTTELNLSQEEQEMEYRNGLYIYEFTDLDKLSTGEKHISVVAEDSQGHITMSDTLILNVYEEHPPEIISVGVKNSTSELGDSAVLNLKEGNSLIFEAEVTDQDGDLSVVYIDLSALNISSPKKEMERVEGNIYRYELQYAGEMENGTYEVFVEAHDEYGHVVKSENTTLTMRETDEPVDGGDDGISAMTFLVPIIIVLLLVIIVILWKTTDIFEKLKK